MSEILEYLSKIKKAFYGEEVRGAIHDAIQQCYYDGKAGTIDLEARQLLNTKADKTDISTPYNFKGSCLFSELPAENNEVNDTYYCTDMKCKYTWNGSEWYQSSLNEGDYEEELGQLSSEITNYANKEMNYSFDVESGITFSISMNTIIPKGEKAKLTITSDALASGVVYYSVNGEQNSHADNWQNGWDIKSETYINTIGIYIVGSLITSSGTVNVNINLESANDKINSLKLLVDNSTMIKSFELSESGHVKALNGTINQYEGTTNSGFIPLDGLYILEYNSKIDSNSALVAFYDENKNYIPSLTITGNGEITVKNGYIALTSEEYALAKYVIISAYNYSGAYGKLFGKFSSKLYGKTINALGDSITSVDYTLPTWWQIISSFSGATFNNYGISSTTIADIGDSKSFVERYLSMSDNADGVIVMGGTNDNTPNLGEFDSTDTTTFYGALNVLMVGLLNKFNGKPILFCTPIQRSNAGDDNYYTDARTQLINSYPTKPIGMQIRAEAIKLKCEQYGIPCLDLYNESGINGYDTNKIYYRSGDNLHPSKKGQERISNIIQAKLETLFR